MINKKNLNHPLRTMLIISIISAFLIISAKCNEIIRVGEDDVLRIELKKSEGSLILKLDANDWKTDDLFYESIGNSFGIFQERDRRWTKEFWNLDLMIDYLRELDWIKEENIVLIIRNFSKFHAATRLTYEMIFKSFEKFILPYWESCKGSERWKKAGIKPKNIDIYYT